MANTNAKTLRFYRNVNEPLSTLNEKVSTVFGFKRMNQDLKDLSNQLFIKTKINFSFLRLVGRVGPGRGGDHQLQIGRLGVPVHRGSPLARKLWTS